MSPSFIFFQLVQAVHIPCQVASSHYEIQQYYKHSETLTLSLSLSLSFLWNLKIIFYINLYFIMVTEYLAKTTYKKVNVGPWFQIPHSKMRSNRKWLSQWWKYFQFIIFCMFVGMPHNQMNTSLVVYHNIVVKIASKDYFRVHGGLSYKAKNQ